MYCKQCGHDVPPGTRICPFCGSEIPFDGTENMKSEIKYCPVCGTQIVHGAKFCTNCGNRLDEVFQNAGFSPASGSNEYTPANNYASGASSYNPYRTRRSTQGRTQGILAVILGFFIPIAGLILGIIAIVKGAKSKYTPAIILGIIGVVVSVAMWAFNYFVLTPQIEKWLEEFIRENYPDGDYICKFFVNIK